ncbi:hypothetical protein niasHS_018027 [Heterodera schachtii]|uniref:Uncharacterized protein n=1 Tax=Heterodera schachtii TaxID=97005 RepID=A0ABD2HV10_HETSC
MDFPFTIIFPLPENLALATREAGTLYSFGGPSRTIRAFIPTEEDHRRANFLSTEVLTSPSFFCQVEEGFFALLVSLRTTGPEQMSRATKMCKCNATLNRIRRIRGLKP